MIGSALKKLAAEHGMKVSHGVAYGSMKGYAATLSEGAGYKRIVLSTLIQDPERLRQLKAEFVGRDLMKEFRVQELGMSDKYINIEFHDNPGTMKKLLAFIDWFFPLLDASGATKADVCVACGGVVDAGRWKLINGTAHYMHEQCAQKILREVEGELENEQLEKKESYLTGLVGALLGAAAGAVVWAVVLSLGYVASIVGLLIGFLAMKGYDLLRGKQGKGKLVILLFAIVFGVVLGTFGAYIWELGSAIQSGEFYGYTYADIPMMLGVLLEDSEFVSLVFKDTLLGLLYAALGAFGLLIKTGKQVSDFRMIDLD